LKAFFVGGSKITLSESCKSQKFARFRIVHRRCSTDVIGRFRRQIATLTLLSNVDTQTPTSFNDGRATRRRITCGADAEIQSEIFSPGDVLANGSQDTDHIDAPGLADNFQQKATQTETPPREVDASIAARPGLGSETRP
jgi:hypothetical protein